MREDRGVTEILLAAFSSCCSSLLAGGGAASVPGGRTFIGPAFRERLLDQLAHLVPAVGLLACKRYDAMSAIRWNTATGQHEQSLPVIPSFFSHASSGLWAPASATVVTALLYVSVL